MTKSALSTLIPLGVAAALGSYMLIKELQTDKKKHNDSIENGSSDRVPPEAEEMSNSDSSSLSSEESRMEHQKDLPETTGTVVAPSAEEVEISEISPSLLGIEVQVEGEKSSLSGLLLLGLFLLVAVMVFAFCGANINSFAESVSEFLVKSNNVDQHLVESVKRATYHAKFIAGVPFLELDG